MTKLPNKLIINLLAAFTLLLGLVVSAEAIEYQAKQSENWSFGQQLNDEILSEPLRNIEPPFYQKEGIDEFESVLIPIRHAQSSQSSQASRYRSKSEVVRAVKARTKGEVLKITLNSKTELYRVRVLLPSGKVRLIRVSALRANN